MAVNGYGNFGDWFLLYQSPEREKTFPTHTTCKTIILRVRPSEALPEINQFMCRKAVQENSATMRHRGESTSPIQSSFSSPKGILGLGQFVAGHSITTLQSVGTGKIDKADYLPTRQGITHSIELAVPVGLRNSFFDLPISGGFQDVW